MLLAPFRWIFGKVIELLAGLLIGGLLVTWVFRWVPLVPVPVIQAFFAGEAPRWQWLRPSETPPALVRAFQLRLQGHRRRTLSPHAAAAATLLYPNPDETWGSEAIGSLLKLLWGEERLLHLHLSSAAWGSGIWGAHSASLHYFQKAPTLLSPEEIAELVLLREYAQATSVPQRPAWFEKQKHLLVRQITHAP